MSNPSGQSEASTANLTLPRLFEKPLACRSQRYNHEDNYVYQLWKNHLTEADIISPARLFWRVQAPVVIQENV